ncbi:TPA: hypothetical protein U1365_001089 [Streptococcus suis]|nr:hypothetical protein [Streptococcus suis]
MSKRRLKKKYRAITGLWKAVDTVYGALNKYSASLDALNNRLTNLEGIESTNVQTINRKFDEYEKRIERLEREVKQPKKPFWKR